MKKRPHVDEGRRALQWPLAGDILEKSEGEALDVVPVPVRPASGLGAETSGKQRLKKT